jgi:hypothetical protein
MLELVTRVIGCIEGHGVTIPPSSRLDRMRRAIVPPDGEASPIIYPGDKDYEVALEAARDFLMLGFAFDQLAQARLAPDVAKRLRTLMNDTALPQDNLTSSQGRDVQCELYVAAVCAKAGLSPTFKEPDVCCTFAGEEFGVAVKRVKSAGTFEDRIRRAVDQVNAAGLPAVIVADVSIMFNRRNERITEPITDAEYYEQIRRRIREYVAEHDGRMQAWFKGSHARGLILNHHDVRLHPKHDWGVESYTLGISRSPFNSRRAREFGAFYDAFKSGLPTPLLLGNG